MSRELAVARLGRAAIHESGEIVETAWFESLPEGDS